MDHSEFCWRNTHNYIGKLSDGKKRQMADKDGLTPEKRKKIEEIKENYKDWIKEVWEE